MKRILTIIALLMSFAAAGQQDITTEGKAFRNAVKKFLTDEGFSPYIDEDANTLDFKKEGVPYWFQFYDSSPIYVRFFRNSTDGSDFTEQQLISAANKTNRYYRAAKCYVRTDKKNISYVVERYTHSIEDFQYTFYSDIEALDNARKAFDKYLEDTESDSAPFKINSVEVANTDQNGNVTTDYGKRIHSSSTQYIMPKLYISTYKPGSYDIYVKFYTPTGMSTGNDSPAGYSYKSSLNLTSSGISYTLSGWGGSTPGHWKAGNYRIEFYYSDKLLYTEYFTIY